MPARSTLSFTAALAVGALSLCTLLFAAPPALAQAAGGAGVPLVVPSQHATIQSAIDAAPPGATIVVMPGLYEEQLRIAGKSLAIVGSGMDATVIRAPHVLRRGEARESSIVEIVDGARVAMSALTVSGPGSGTCKKGALKAGIRVMRGAHLALSSAAVRHIQDTPLAACFRSGHGILIGQAGGPGATAAIDRSEVTQFQAAGIIALGTGSFASITRNTITGPGHAGGVATDGIELVVGAAGTVSQNVVSGNVCPAGDPTCGPDWFTQFQHAGILADGPGTVVTGNLVHGNQIGIFVGPVDRLADNRAIDNALYGLGLIDGDFLVEGGVVSGGGAGLWAVAQGANTTVRLRDVGFNRLGGPAVDKLECCGFTATVTVVP